MSIKKKSLFDFHHPFFDPLWRRIATFVVCFGWGLVEFVFNNTLWGVLFCGVGLLAGYSFFVADKPARDD